MTYHPNHDFSLKIYNDRAEWIATLAYGDHAPTADAIRAKIAEYNGTTAVMHVWIAGREDRREEYR